MTRIYMAALLFVAAHSGYGQAPTGLLRDSVPMTMRAAEDSFLRNNLALIAGQYSIDSAKATVITARLWDNPELDYSNAFYNFQDHHYFEPEMNVQVSQLIRLAGKRNKAITAARSGIDVAQYQFYDLMRTLRYVLRSDFYNIYFLQRSAALYDLEIRSLRGVIAPMQEQVSKGYLAPIEVLRIQSQLYTLQAEYDALQTSIESVESELKLIIRAPAEQFIEALPDTAALQQDVVARWSYQELLDTAMTHRPDLKALTASVLFNRNNLDYQRALARPDLTVTAGYDRLGSYVKDYNFIGIGIPLPLFNRNQGNIRNARIAVDQSSLDYQSGVDRVRSDVSNGYVTALRAERLLQSFDPAFDAQNRNMIDQVTGNYRKKNITLLEFLDYYDSYKQNVLQLNQLRYNKMNALEQLNYATGMILFN